MTKRATARPVEAGVHWDIVAIPAVRGMPLYHWLAADYPDQLGPVAARRRSHRLRCSR
ncbi:hypothetical protein [Streptacidiphilus sp. EB129]|uniref:hypothetical protein n=1 Tax=Streptacidiphilus sp. EB129 TaxID=3156262 RepID=UPI0035161EBA